MQKANDTKNERIIRFSYTSGGGKGLFMLVLNAAAHNQLVGKGPKDPTDRVEISCEGRLNDNGSPYFRVKVLNDSTRGGLVAYERDGTFVYRRGATFSHRFKKSNSKKDLGLEKPFMFGRTQAVELTSQQLAELGVEESVDSGEFFIYVPLADMKMPQAKPKEQARQNRKRTSAPQTEFVTSVTDDDDKEYNVTEKYLRSEEGFKWLVQQLNNTLMDHTSFGIAGTDAETSTGGETVLRGKIYAVRRPVVWAKL